jgi:small subunit ribosomal protein S21
LEIKVVGQNIERAIKLLKREAEKEGLFRELKKRRFYEKPSEKRKSKQREAQKKRAKNARYKTQYGQRSRPAGSK